jgi:type I restriction enzyme M protein
MNAEYNSKVKQLVDDIKNTCAHNGLWGDANEYKIVTQSFLYKFINDKFMYEVQKLHPNLKNYKDFEKLSDDKYNNLRLGQNLRVSNHIIS